VALYPVKKTGNAYVLSKGNTIRTGLNKISFAITGFDRLSGSNNPNGIYAAKIFMDGKLVSEFVLDRIDYDETRYMNAHIDYKMKTSGGPYMQHLSPMPGDTSNVYKLEDGIIYLYDSSIHKVSIEVFDAHKNRSALEFNIQHDESLVKPAANNGAEQFIPEHVNVFETAGFELFATEYTVYDTVSISYSTTKLPLPGNISDRQNFLSHLIPSHDSVTVRIRPNFNISQEQMDRTIIQMISGNRKNVKKTSWNNGWARAKFRNFGSYQVFVDNTPPVINSIGTGDTVNLTKTKRLRFSPTDNFNSIRNFRAEVDGQWLMFTNDKGKIWYYTFDEYFPAGVHELKVSVEDEAGNITEKKWWVRR
jgi:hypothetical protein